MSVPFVVTDNYITNSNNIAQFEIENIQDALNLLNHDELYSAIRIVREATEVDLFNVSYYVLIRDEFSHDLNKKRVDI